MINSGDGDVQDFLERRVLPWTILLAFVISTADDIWHFLPAVGSKDWEAPLQLFVLWVILRSIQRLTHISERTERQVDAIDKGVAVCHYENRKQVYHALNMAVAGADSKVYVVYESLRSPSEDIAEVKTYFDSARKWAEDGPEGSRKLQRIIRVPDGNRSLMEWAERELDLGRETPNYDAAIINASGSLVEGRSFAVIDDRLVFVIFYIEDKGRLRSHSIQSMKVASDYMECFDAMWGSARERSVSP